MAMNDRLQALIKPIVDELGLELFDLTYAGGTLSVMVQRPASERKATSGEGTTDAVPGAGAGVDVSSITAVSRAVSRMLDEVDPISGAYSLEVSSPGLERPLRTLAHFTDAIGECISVKTLPNHDGPRRVKGELVAATPDDITLRLSEGPSGQPSDGAPDATVTIPLVAIDKARTVFVWGPEPKPTRPTAPKAKAKVDPVKANSAKTNSAKASSAKARATKKHATKKVTSS